jgi:hypothetical protein
MLESGVELQANNFLIECNQNKPYTVQIFVAKSGNYYISKLQTLHVPNGKSRSKIGEKVI